MEGIERVHDLLDELSKTLKGIFPKMSTSSFTVAPDGYRTITVMQWGKSVEDIETRKRRELFEQTCLNGEWEKDRSAEQNEYYKKLGVLLGVKK